LFAERERDGVETSTAAAGEDDTFQYFVFCAGYRSFCPNLSFVTWPQDQGY
jgi:hypothetical protein